MTYRLLRQGRSPLVLTEQKEHLKALTTYLEPHVKNVITLHGGRRARESHAIATQLGEIPDGEDRVLAILRGELDEISPNSLPRSL